MEGSVIKIGTSASIKKIFTQEEVRIFSEISLDSNPIHLDAEYASRTKFGKPIVQGFFVGSLISAVIANKLPGEGSIYINQTMNFELPVFIGDEITATIKIEHIKNNKVYYLDTKCYNQNGEIVINGTATILKKPTD